MNKASGDAQLALDYAREYLHLADKSLEKFRFEYEALNSQWVTLGFPC